MEMAVTMDAVTARGLVKAYDGRSVVDNVSLSINGGEVLCIIGPNGAGKTTLIEMLMGLRSPDSGSVAYGFDNPKAMMGVQLQQGPFVAGLSALENLILFGALHGLSLDKGGAKAILKDCGLCEVSGTEASRLSGGQRKRLSIAIALLGEPKVLFLDEPNSDLDPRARREVRALVRRLAEKGTAVVVASHDMEEVGKLADRILLMNGGKALVSGKPDELLKNGGYESLEGMFLAMTEMEAC